MNDVIWNDFAQKAELLQSVLESTANSASVYKALRNEQGEITDFEWLLANTVAEGEAGGNSLAGKHYCDVFPHLRETEAFKKYIEVVESGQRADFEINYKKDGHNRWLRIIAVKLGDGLVVTSEDVTERKLSEQMLQYNQRFVEKIAHASPYVIYVLDMSRFEIIYSNRNIAALLGYSKEEIKMMNVPLDLIHKDDLPTIWKHIQDMKTSKDGEIIEVYYRLVDVSGKSIWYRDMDTIFKRDENGVPVEKLGFSIDVNKEKEAEIKLRQNSEELQKLSRELKSLNRSLVKKNKELHAKNNELTTFTYVTSHDLKEPLRKIYTFSEMLQVKEKEKLSDEGKTLFKRIQASVQRMQLMTDDILTYAQIDSKDKIITRVSLNKVLNLALDHLQDIIASRGAIIEAEPLPDIDGYHFLLIQLFQNIIDNSIKFQPVGNIPHIEIKSMVVKGKKISHSDAIPEQYYLQLSFKDNGIGFDKKYEEQIFRMFQRLNNKETYYGTGIGLPICKKVMDLHNGFMIVDAKPGDGCTFYCYFPITIENKK